VTVTNWLTLVVTRSSITVGTSGNGYVTGSAPDLTTGFPAADLAWFMENTQDALFGPEADRAAAVLQWLRTLPSTTSGLWESGPVREFVARTLPADISSLDIFICSLEPEILAFPWELVTFPAPFSDLVFCQAGRIERIETGQFLPPDTAADGQRSPVTQVKTMLVSPRPRLQGDVPFAPTVGAALVAAARFTESLRVDVVNPPTLDAVRSYLEVNGQPNVVHFDGHGDSGADGGRLFFEGGRHGVTIPVSGGELALLFKKDFQGTVLLNACRSSFHLPGRDAGSVAGDISRSFPAAVVIAMSYKVGVPLVLRLMQAIYPAIGAGGDPSSAVARVRRDLFAEWKADQSGRARPHFLTARVFTAKVRGQVPGVPGSPAVPALSADERGLTHWIEEILAVDRLRSRGNGLVWVTGMVGSGKKSLAKALRQYYDLTSGNRAVPAVVDYHKAVGDQVTVPAEGIVFATGEVGAAAAVHRLHFPPRDLVTDLMRPTIERHGARGESGALPVLAFELSALASAHLSTAVTLARAAAVIGTREAIDYLRWGSSLDFEDDGVRAVRALIPKAGLTKEQVTAFAVLGLFDGWIIPPLLPILTNGGLAGDRFLATFGRHVTQSEWDVLLDAGAGAGLLDFGPGRVCRVVPVVALVLRGILVAEFGATGLSDLQLEMASAMAGWLSQSSRLDFWSSLEKSEWHSHRLQVSALSIFAEENIVRALRFAIRNQHDSLAAEIAYGYMGDQIGDHFRNALSHTTHILAYEGRPDVKYDELGFVVSRAEATLAKAALKWLDCLKSAERALDLAASIGVDADLIVSLSCMKAHSLARLHRVEAAVRTITEAAARCLNTGAREYVLEEFSNIIELLHMADADIADAEQMVYGAFANAVDGPASVYQRPVVRERMEEIDYWEAEQRRSLIRGDAVRAAHSTAEIGRLLGLVGETAQADSFLRAALGALSRLGSPVGRTQYFLGMTWEIGDDFEKARRWISGALAASADDERLVADCTYELGIIEVRAGNYSRAFEVFDEARRAYLSLGRAREAADALFMAAQAALAGDSDIDPVAQMLQDVLAAQPLDPEVTRRARELLAEIRDAGS
jgi:tetratricopeptide (TPR) repeat protein